MTSDQLAAISAAVWILERAGVGVEDALFADGRAPTPNERHLLNLLAWRSAEAARLREEIARLQLWAEHGSRPC